MPVGICTIVAKNYLPRARVLMASLRRHAPETKHYVILADEPDGLFNPEDEDFEVITASQLPIPGLDWLRFKYSILEYCTALKPHVLDYLLRQCALDKVVYLDPDVEVFAPLDELLDVLEERAIVLTPHITSSIEDSRHPAELDILRTGVYNLGFIGLSWRPNAFELLKWWKARLADQCVLDFSRGLFVDQRWMDLAPCLFPDLEILRDPGYNVAYWNLQERYIERTGNRTLVNGRPLVFFHFSGYDPRRPEQLSRYQDRFDLSSLGAARTLVDGYRDKVLVASADGSNCWPYSFSRYRNGTLIPDVVRPIHRLVPEIIDDVADPFSDVGFRGIARAWNRSQEFEDGAAAVEGLSRLAWYVHETSSDLRQRFPDIRGRHRQSYLSWITTDGRRQLGLDDAFLTPCMLALENCGADPACSSAKDSAPGPGGQAVGEAAAATAGENLSQRLTGASSLRALISFLQAEGAGTSPPDLIKTIYAHRPDLQKRYPDPDGDDALDYLAWILTYGRSECGLPEALLSPVRERWQQMVDQRPNSADRTWRRLTVGAMGVSASIRARVSGLQSRVVSQVSKALSHLI